MSDALHRSHNLFDYTSHPVMIVDNKPPFTLHDCNSAAKLYLMALASQRSAEIPKDGPLLIGMQMMPFLSSNARDYFPRATQTSELLGLPIYCMIPGISGDLPPVPIIIENLTNSGLASFTILQSVSANAELIRKGTGRLQMEYLNEMIIFPRDGFPDVRFTLVTPILMKMLGYYDDPEVLHSMQISDLLHSSSISYPFDEKKLSEGGFQVIHFNPREGKRVSLSLNSALILGIDGNHYYRSIVSDVTEMHTFADNKMVEGSIHALTRILEQGSGETLLHAETVAEIVLQFVDILGIETELANQFGISTEYLRYCLRIGGILHDLGKIGVPQSILNKEGKLNECEWEIMRRHPQFGAETIADLLENTIFQIVLIMIKGHHYNWDGKGYPDNTSGENIHILARITAIADSFAALLSKRPYKDSMDEIDALQEMQKQSGKKFDPTLLNRFADAVHDGRVSASLLVE